jgi:hypothetical protein
MNQRKQTHNDLSVTLRVLARLLQYPDAASAATCRRCAPRCTARASSAASGWPSWTH